MHAWPEELLSLANTIRDHGPLPEDIAACPRYALTSALNIYRNNYRENLHHALAAAYPIVEQLVGADFFRLLARQFIAQHPSRSGNLHHYGAQLPAFLASFTAAQSLPYLADFARLEWACHVAYYAADRAPFNPLRLHEIAPADFAKLIWHCHPACCVLHSPYPLLAIWQAHQPGASADFHIDLNQTGGNLLVSRNDDEVQVSVLSPAAADWLRRIQAVTALGVATEATLANYADFDLTATLNTLVASAVLIDFSLS